MNENTLINSKKNKTAIFNSLMDVEFRPNFTKRNEELQRELQQLEQEGKLKIYHPEQRGSK